jgi:RNA polymerase sigma factor (sigma-70 family)
MHKDDHMETQITKVERTNDEWRNAIVNQDAAAWRELSQLLYRASYQLASQQLNRLSAAMWHEVAVDSVQDAGLRIVRRLEQYRGSGPFVGWCYVIVINATRDRIRRERRRLRQEVEEWVEDLAPASADFAPRVEDQLFLDELTEHIYRFVRAELSEREQKVFLALAQAESTPKELALALETTRNNIDQTWHRSRQKVRQHLERTGYTHAALQDHDIL